MRLFDRLDDSILILDGATGSELQKMGLKPGELPEVWNVTHPDALVALHKSYFEAGSDCVATNTFGANPIKYTDDAEYSLEEIIKAAVSNVRKAASLACGELVARERYVGLDVGPLGKLLAPLGELSFEDAVSAFKKSISIGLSQGVDFVIIETMNDAYETKAAVVAYKEALSEHSLSGEDVPVFVSNVYDETQRTMTGASSAVMSTLLDGLRVNAVGSNCSLGPDKMLPIVSDFYENTEHGIIFMPNAGLPRVENGKTVYDTDPDTFASVCAEAVKRGANLIGGCCGTTPEHIKAVSRICKKMPVLPRKRRSLGAVCSFSQNVVFEAQPVLIGERINPTGKKKLKEALRSNDMSYILSEAVKQDEAGAHVLDINTGLPEIDEVAVLTEVVEKVQSVTALPLQIDTGNAAAMEHAVRVYNGKPMINSVNGKNDVMEAVFPIVQKYGGYVVCLTLDEEGIPTECSQRIDIAKKIISKASEYGIRKEDLIFDPLALSVSADDKAAVETLKTVRVLTEEVGVKCSLGVSNVSFGLPRRDIITSTFFTMALQNGLAAAIMNPFSVEMMKSYTAFCTLAGFDGNCLGYIDFASKLPDEGSMPDKGQTVAVKDENKEKTGDEPDKALFNAIYRGLADKAYSETVQLLTKTDALEVINRFIIPALDEVGKGFEKKTIYLPQLLMSAEAAKSAFAAVSEKLPEGAGNGPRIIMATVKGDIHDIGKNIVTTLLKNYGFDVIDLGKDVAPEKIIETIKKYDVKLVGLSALMTTTVPSMEETIRAIRKLGDDIKVVVGGAVLNQEYADMIGADKYSPTAMDTVRYAEELFR